MPRNRYWVETVDRAGEFGGISVDATSKQEALDVAARSLLGTRRYVSLHKLVVLERRNVEPTALLAGAVAAAAILVGSQADAQPMCDDHQSLSSNLSDRYGEKPVWAGINKDGALVAAYANPETGSWTMTVREPTGTTACVLGIGNRFTLDAPKAPDETGS